VPPPLGGGADEVEFAPPPPLQAVTSAPRSSAKTTWVRPGRTRIILDLAMNEEILMANIKQQLVC
jgi:hypothetical protein